MTVHDRSRRRVQATLDRLAADDGPVDVHEDRYAVPTDRYEAIRERFEAGSVGYAGVRVINDEGEVLLISQSMAGRIGYDGTLPEVVELGFQKATVEHPPSGYAYTYWPGSDA